MELPSTPEPTEPVRTLAGKYDGRRFNGGHNALASKDGSIPVKLKNISRVMARRGLREIDKIATVAMVYASAWEGKQLSLCDAIRDRLERRAYGNPFTQSAPDTEDSRHPAPSLNIRNLQIVNNDAGPAHSKAAKPRRKRPSGAASEAKQLTVNGAPLTVNAPAQPAAPSAAPPIEAAAKPEGGR